MTRSLTVISLLLQSATHCRYRVYTKFLLTYTAIYRGNRKVLSLGITALQPQSHFHLGTLYSSDRIFRRNKIHVIFNKVFENRTVLEIMCRSQITRWCMRITCWIPRLHTHTHTHTEYVIHIAVSPYQRLHESISVLALYILCLSCSLLH